MSGPQLLMPPGGELIYDHTNKDGELFLLDRSLEGCICLRFDRTVTGERARVDLDGKPVPVVLRDFPGMTVLGVDLRRVLNDYGKKALLTVSGFRSFEGEEMEPVTLPVSTPEREAPRPEYAAHEAVALQAAEEGIVLLKNEGGLLPLPEGTKLNFFGKGIWSFRCSATGAGKINPRYMVDLTEALAREPRVGANGELLDFYRCLEDRVPDEVCMARARAFSDLAIFVLTRPTGENVDNSTAPGEFDLSAEEETLLGTLRTHFSKLLVILNTGYPVAMGLVEKYKVDAVLYCGFGGMLGGKALLNVLLGRVNPSGRLPDTWVNDYAELPTAANFYDAYRSGKRLDGNAPQWLDTVYAEDIFLGYRYFSSFDKPMAYPFGFGLSYTTFSMQAAQSGRDFAVTVTNTGSRAGKEVVQFYLQRPETELEKVKIELIDFAKTRELLPGDSETLRFSVTDRQLRVYDEKQSAWVLEAGEYRLLVGPSCAKLQEAGRIRMDREQVQKLPHRMQMPEALRSAVSGLRDGPCERRKSASFPPRFRFPETAENLPFSVDMDEEECKAYVAGLTTKQLVRLCVCSGDGWGVEGTGEAGHLCTLPGKNLPRFVVADGNSGVNMRKPNIGFPSGATLAASFNKDLLGEVGRVIGEEARELGVDMILAPGFNLHRSPLCGRQAEYFSEDPCLAGKLAAAFAEGLESTGVAGCYKHLIANGAESARKRNDSILSERAIRELYFKAFAIALEEYQPLAVMTAYNQVNGLHCCEDAELIQGLLRDECGFAGFVMTDWCSYDTADLVEMMKAGISWITPGSSDETYTAPIETAVRQGRLSREQLEENAFYLLRALCRLKKRKHEAIRDL